MPHFDGTSWTVQGASAATITGDKNWRTTASERDSRLTDAYNELTEAKEKHPLSSRYPRLRHSARVTYAPQPLEFALACCPRAANGL